MNRVVSSTVRPPEDPAVLTARLLLRIGFAVLAIIVPVTAAFSRRAVFILLPFAACLILISGTLTHARQGRGRLLDASLSPTGMAVVFLLLWSALSLIWTPFPSDAGMRLFKAGGTVVLVSVAVAFLPERMRLSTLYLVPIGTAAAAILTLALTLYLGFAPGAPSEADGFSLQRAAITLAILIWPALSTLTLRERWIGALVLALATSAAAIAANAPIAMLALGGGLLAYGAAYLDRRRTAKFLSVASAALFLCAPFLPILAEAAVTAATGSVPDFMRPIAVWADIVRANKARLVTGHGLEATMREVIGGYLPIDTPRSFLFAIWYELGIVGAIAMAVIVASAFWGALRTGPGVAPFLIAALAAALIFAVLGENAAQLWWVTVLGVGAIAFAGVLNGQYHTKRPQLRAVSEPRQS